MSTVTNPIDAPSEAIACMASLVGSLADNKAALGQRYLAAALKHLSPEPPVLVAVGGRSGSGKSTVARALAPALGAAPGAVMLEPA